MSREDKKKRKLIANRQKQAKFTAKYGVYHTPSKFIPKETQADMEETGGTEIHTEPEQVNAMNESSKTTNLDTHAFFQKIENNVLNPKKENKVVVESKPKEEPKPTYSVPPIPGMRSTPKRESIHDAPKLTEEERQAKELADAKVMLEKLKNNHTGTIQERQDRAKMIQHYQGIVDRHRSFDDFVKQTNELAEKTRREAQERAEREKQLKELENASKNDLIKDEGNRSSAEKEEIEENKTEQTEQKVEAIAIAIANESGAVERVHIPNFYDQFDERKMTGAITERVKAELTDIIKDAGIRDAETADTIAERSYANILEGLNFDYARGEIRAKTRDAVKNCFDNANLSLRDAGLSMKNRIITAQKIADVMLKNYSPVAFANHLLDHYAEGYVVNDDEFIEDQLRFENVPQEQRESMKQELQYGFANGLYEDELLEQVNAPDENTKDNVEPQPPNISNFDQWLYNQTANENVHKQVSSELTDIIKAAGITDQESLSKVEKVHEDIPQTIPLNRHWIDGETPNMPNIAVTFFASSYDAISKSDLSLKDRIITAQKMADLLLKNYSPVVMKDFGFDQYAHNYVVNNKNLLVLCMEARKISKDEVEPLIDEIQTALPNVTKNEQPAAKPELTQEEKNRLLFGVDVDQYRQDKRATKPETKQAPPQQEPPQQNPATNQAPLPKPNPTLMQNLGPEWINMSEFDQKLERLKKIEALPGNTKKQISEILKESGVETGGADDPLDFNEIIKDAYDPKKLPRDVPQSMRDITKSVFISTYDALSKKGLTPKNKIETTQKIADVFLKLHSPASLSIVTELKKYTQNYVINDKNLLRECLTTLKVPENEIKAIVGDEAKPEVKTEAKPEVKTEAKAETKPISSEARVAVYTEKLKAYNNMYKLDIDSNDFAVSVIDAWALMKSGDAQKKENGQKIMGDMVKNILQRSFDVEKNASYKEHRIPEFNEIIKSTNELLRSSMYAFTDLYHDPQSAVLFQSTAFGGLTAKEMTALTAGDSIWKMDQKSDKAWEIQSHDAKALADQWLKEDKPYEKMINEMNALIESNKNGTLERQEMYTKLTAAEWLLINNEKMMIEDPEDPINPIPNWGNRYWKAIVGARESLGIDRHTSMREMIQGEYAACANAANSTQYHAVQIEHFVQNPKERENYDSLEKQKVEFATQSAAFHISEPPKDKTNENVAETEEDYIRKREPVQSEDQRKIMKNEPKVFSNLVIERTNELTIDSVREDRR